jgi:hypothetical protein
MFDFSLQATVQYNEVYAQLLSPITDLGHRPVPGACTRHLPAQQHGPKTKQHTLSSLLVWQSRSRFFEPLYKQNKHETLVHRKNLLGFGIVGDCKSVIMQSQGTAKTNGSNFGALYEVCEGWYHSGVDPYGTEQGYFKHLPRKYNSRADALASIALRGGYLGGDWCKKGLHVALSCFHAKVPIRVFAWFDGGFLNQAHPLLGNQYGSIGVQLRFRLPNKVVFPLFKRANAVKASSSYQSEHEACAAAVAALEAFRTICYNGFDEGAP